MVEESELVRTLRSHKGLNDLQMWRMRDEAANRIAALEAQLAERVKVTNGESLAEELRRLVSEYNEPDTDGTRDEAWNLIADFAIANYGTILSAIEATPPAPKVTEAMVEAASHEYMRIFGKHLLSEHAQAILTAAQDAGKP